VNRIADKLNEHVMITLNFVFVCNSVDLTYFIDHKNNWIGHKLCQRRIVLSIIHWTL